MVAVSAAGGSIKRVAVIGAGARSAALASSWFFTLKSYSVMAAD
jgi:hypothetical protein